MIPASFGIVKNWRLFVLPLGVLLIHSPAWGAFSQMRYLMGTVCEIQVETGSEADARRTISRAFDEMDRLEKMMSSYRPGSEVVRLNAFPPGIPFHCSDDLFQIIRRSIAYQNKTNGAFDITRGALPIKLALEHQTLTRIDPAVQLDLGGIGKGFALDKAAEILTSAGVDHAMMNFGGQIYALNQESEIRIAHPRDPSRTVAQFVLRTGSVSTSAQTPEKEPIIDPGTGKPVAFSGSVTVVSPSATEADALSTAFLILGPKLTFDFIKEKAPRLPVLFALTGLPPIRIQISDNWTPYRLKVYPPLKGDLQSTSSSDSGYF